MLNLVGVFVGELLLLLSVVERVVGVVGVVILFSFDVLILASFLCL